tara:strand:- start:31021 stop:31677 length:657 start_codon:yes stop_codon:yes gene_type:complete
MQHSIASNGAVVVARQRELLREKYRQFIEPGERYALVDFPDHSNVDDSAIWLGELALLHEITGRFPSYVCSREDYDGDALKKSVPDGPIFSHGGSNNCAADLVPDAALGLGNLEAPHCPVMEVFCLLRTDLETSGTDHKVLRDAGYEIDDRPHGHIPCTLMGKPHVALDNSYGKVSGYWDNWHRGVNNVHSAHSIDEVVPVLSEFGLAKTANKITPRL